VYAAPLCWYNVSIFALQINTNNLLNGTLYKLITADQIRMARAALKWSVRDLAEKSGLTPNTVSRIENGAESFASTIQRIQVALEQGGILFIEQNGGGPGVRLRNRQESGR
jgi:DNA-binding XRE family transcriptional regulator